MLFRSRALTSCSQAPSYILLAAGGAGNRKVSLDSHPRTGRLAQSLTLCLGPGWEGEGAEGVIIRPRLKTSPAEALVVTAFRHPSVQSCFVHAVTPVHFS